MDPILIAAGLGVMGNLFQGWAQGKVTEQQLKLQAQQLGLSRQQFEFMRAQALRQNKVQSHNVGRVNPMLDKMLERSTADAGVRPNPVDLQPPGINNPYGGRQPPRVGPLPGFNNGENDPVRLAQLLMGR